MANGLRLILMAAFFISSIFSNPLEAARGNNAPDSPETGEQEQVSYSLYGQVLDESNRFLPDARVSLGGSQAVTGADGKFNLGGLSKGSQVLSLRKDGYQTLVQTVVVLRANQSGGNFTLKKIVQPTAGAFSGRVKDYNAPARPIGAARVNIGNRMAVADPSTGRFQLDNVVFGNYTIQIFADGYEDTTYPNIAFNAGTTAQLADKIYFVKRKQAVVAGTISSFASGQALSGVRVALGQRIVTTTGDGKFKFENVPYGQVKINASRDGFKPLDLTLNLNWESPQDRQVNAPLFLKPLASLKLRGTVRDSLSNRPLGNVAVRLDTLNQHSFIRQATSDGSGIFTIDDVPEGRHRITASLAGYHDHNGYHDISEQNASNGIVSVDIPMGVKTPDGVIAGTVRDKANRSPISGATVRWTIRDPYMTKQNETDSSGVFRLEGMRLGQYRVDVFAAGIGYRDYSADYQLIGWGLPTYFDLEKIECPIVHGSAKGIKGRVGANNAAQGQAVSGASVSLDSLRGTTDANGQYLLSGNISFGNHTIQVSHPNYEPYSRAVLAHTCYDGKEISHAVALIPKAAGSGSGAPVVSQSSATIRGRVVLSDGSEMIPVANAAVSFEGPRRGLVRTNAAGEFEVAQLPMGVYSLYVSESSVGTSDRKSVNITSLGVTNVELVILDSEEEIEVEVEEHNL
ncbi:MAG: carboxypeptidase regulatory-like domain-containing protein [Elusimicrobia bacterium]|nr:carboxypeptidase regulatory-like domain-containing protein [Elusimicrobiota bacterium]